MLVLMDRFGGIQMKKPKRYNSFGYTLERGDKEIDVIVYYILERPDESVGIFGYGIEDLYATDDDDETIELSDTEYDHLCEKSLEDADWKGYV